MKSSTFFLMTVLSVLLLLSACGGGTSDSRGIAVGYTVSGAVSDLLAPGLVLQNNGGDDLAVAAYSTSFTFPTTVVDGENYNVTIKTQPAKQFCLVTRGSGTVSSASVTDVDVSCSIGLHIIR